LPPGADVAHHDPCQAGGKFDRVFPAQNERSVFLPSQSVRVGAGLLVFVRGQPSESPRGIFANFRQNTLKEFLL